MLLLFGRVDSRTSNGIFFEFYRFPRSRRTRHIGIAYNIIGWTIGGQVDKRINVRRARTFVIAILTMEPQRYSGKTPYSANDEHRLPTETRKRTLHTRIANGKPTRTAKTAFVDENTYGVRARHEFLVIFPQQKQYGRAA